MDSTLFFNAHVPDSDSELKQATSRICNLAAPLLDWLLLTFLTFNGAEITLI